MTTNVMDRPTKFVTVGAIVEISIDGDDQVWEITESGKFDIGEGKISIDAPLAQAIIGLKEGDVVARKIRDREVVISIKKFF